MEDNMKATEENTKIVTITMNEAEAVYLKGLVQNFIGGELNTENPLNQKIRMSFWNALDDMGIEV